MPVTLSVPATAAAPALLLRPWRTGDANALLDARVDQLMLRQLNTSLTDEETARQWLAAQRESWETGTRFSFAIMVAVYEAAEADAGRPVGHLAINAGNDPTGSSAEVGYWIAARSRGRGFVPRALAAATNWAFGPECPLPLTTLELRHSVGNHASCRVAEKCGYQLRTLLPAQPPVFPTGGHLHVRDHLPAAVLALR